MKRMSWIVVVVSLAGAATAYAHGPDRAAVLRSQVGLDEATAQRVEGVMQRHRDEMRAHRDKTRDARQALRKLVDSGSKDDAAYRAALDGLERAHDEKRRLHEAHRGELKQLLTPQQQARLVLARQGMHRGRHRP